MKHLLATTTILALSAGFAAAEVTLSGDARMGIISPFGGGDTAFTSRARVKFSMSGESDGGLAFGASFRAHNAGDAASGTAGEVWMSTGGFKLSMGDVDGAAQAAVGQTDGVGLTGLGDMNEINYLGAGGASPAFFLDAGFGWPAGTALNGDPTALMEYTAGSLSLYASVTQPSYTFNDGFFTWTGDSVALGAAYAMDGYRFSLGYENWAGERTGLEGSADNLVVGADATFGAVTMKARYSAGGSEFSGSAFQDHTQWSLSATYVADALSVTGYVSNVSIDQVSVFGTDYERDAYGIGAAYDLGGGASVVGGYAVDTTADDSAFDLGLSFSF